MKITEAALSPYPELLNFIHTQQNITTPRLDKNYIVRCEDGHEFYNYILTPIEIIARMGLIEHLKVLLYPSTRFNLSIYSVFSSLRLPYTQQAKSRYTKFEDALFQAIDGGHLDIVQYILWQPNVLANLDKPNTDNNTKLRSLIMRAVEADVPSMEILTTLLSIPCIANVVNSSILVTAIEKRLPSQIDYLLTLPQVSSSLASCKNKVLRVAISYNQTDLVNQLLDNPDVMSIITANYNRVLKIAAFVGNLECINRLLEDPEVRNNADSEGNAALQMAAIKGHINVVKRLLEISCVADNVACANNIVFRHVVYNHTYSRSEPILDKSSQKEMIRLLLTCAPVAERARNEIRSSIASYNHSLRPNKTRPIYTSRHQPATPITLPSDEQIERFLSGQEIEETITTSIYQLIAYKSYEKTIDRTRCEFETNTNGLSYPIGGASNECLPYWGVQYEIGDDGNLYDDNGYSIHYG